MKKIISIPFLFFALLLNAQTDVLPQKINDPFFKKYPKASDITWVKDSSIYSIEFYQYGDMFTSLFDEEGNWLETGVVIPDDQLPVNFKQALNDKYPRAILIYCEKVETIEGSTYFRANIETNEASLIIKSDAQGNISGVTKNYDL